MIIPEKYKQFLDEEALVIVAGKEHGLIYRIKEGTNELVEEVAEHPPRYSDDEGFFFHGTKGKPGTMGAGAPKEYDESVYLKKFEKEAAKELDTLIKSEDAELLYVFEPEHLKGRIVEHLEKHPKLVVHTVRHGNYVNEEPLQLVEYIHDYIEANKSEKSDEEDYERDLEQSS